MQRPHVLDELRQFMDAVNATKNNFKLLTSSSLIRSSLYLLESHPAARELYFDYFAKVAEYAVQLYTATANVNPQTGLVTQQQTGKNANQQQTPAEEIDFASILETLEDLVSNGPLVWCTVITSWSLGLLGRLVDKFTQHKMNINASCNFWFNCETVKGLLKCVSIAFRKMTNAEAEICVKTLLTTYNRFGTTFDWVVARLGGCFPTQIITQILLLSLKRFTEDFRSQFDSEIGILDYLSFAHEQELKAVLRDMLQNGFYPNTPLDAMIIPYLLYICNLSDILLQHVVSVFLEMYNDDLRNTIIHKSKLWMANQIFAEMQPSLNNITIRLKSNGAAILIKASTMAEEYMWCQDFLESSLAELEELVLSARDCPLLTDITTQETKEMLWTSCLSTNLLEQQTAVRLLLLVSTQSPIIYHQTISVLMRKSYDGNPNGLGAVIRMIAGQYGAVEFPTLKPGLLLVFEDVLRIEQVGHAYLTIEDGETASLDTFKNLNKIVQMHKKHKFTILRENVMEEVLQSCLTKILQILEVIIKKLLLHMDADIEALKEQQSSNNNENHNQYARSMHSKIPKLEYDDDVEMKDVNAKKQEFDNFPEDAMRKAERNKQRLALAKSIIDLLNAIGVGNKAEEYRAAEAIKLSWLSVKYFFIAVSQRDFECRMEMANCIYPLLSSQCNARKLTRNTCLRELLEGVLFYYGYLFGQQEPSIIDDLEIPLQELVLNQNQRQNLGPNANRSVLHSGVIGRGLRPRMHNKKSRCDPQKGDMLLVAIRACCADTENRQNSTEAYSLVSLLLVEFVSPDVMYNGLPFPDEEFSKVTMERDLLIRRAFNNFPVLWLLLELMAQQPPALCFSSVLLRALCATCLHQWRARNVDKDNPPRPDDELLWCTKRLLYIMTLGMLLPDPLSHLHNIIGRFTPPEIAVLLKECIWNYLKDHVPSPALFQIDARGFHFRNMEMFNIPQQYVDPMHNLILRSPEKFQDNYFVTFVLPMLPKDVYQEVQLGKILEGEVVQMWPNGIEKFTAALKDPVSNAMSEDAKIKL